jgi:hypothetical protein
LYFPRQRTATKKIRYGSVRIGYVTEIVDRHMTPNYLTSDLICIKNLTVIDFDYLMLRWGTYRCPTTSPRPLCIKTSPSSRKTTHSHKRPCHSQPFNFFLQFIVATTATTTEVQVANLTLTSLLPHDQRTINPETSYILIPISPSESICLLTAILRHASHILNAPNACANSFPA